MHKYRIGITETVNFDNGLRVKKAVIRVQWARDREEIRIPTWKELSIYRRIIKKGYRLQFVERTGIKSLYNSGARRA